ncbi:hypothetical protein C453_09758 [Haloferax elongans ATCC BAA-1513]|uniref:DUF7965 domain-containing protein n=1 Tax=Haloferax elongans ATCC BAA-1513 TaxID=1230453 RepID=M0HQS5_HALEO|nr:hypothetical protein [Haloferax elongans]ELZ86093.1 hypothetical protein C453_09758 [Haloferax elongans ATCC BAA-1513]
MADADRLETWTITTVNVTLLSLIGVFAAHTSGVLTNALSGFGTLPGVAVFTYLWVVVWLSTRWAVADGGLDRIAREDSGFRSLVLRGIAGGAASGVVFVFGILVTAFLASVSRGELELTSFALFGLFGGGVSGVVGGVIGGVSVVLDAAVYLVATHVGPKQDGESATES